jgi:uncharacterized protein (DUF934 family)
MALLKNGKLCDDVFTDVSAAESLPAGDDAIIVSLQQWSEHRAALANRSQLGIVLTSADKAELIADDLEHFTVIALEFPAFGDGRAYSTATLLRRFGYAGELRAVGEVLLEQLHFMHRVGFDAFVIDSDDAAREWEIAAADISVWYQPTVDDRESIVKLRHA